MNRARVAIGVLSVVAIVQALALSFLFLSVSQPDSTLIVGVTSAGVPLTGVEGRVIVYREGERQAPYANGLVGQSLALAPGVYDLRLVLTGAAGAPAGWLTGVDLAEGEDEEASVEVAVGELMLSIDTPASGTVLIQVFEEGKHDHVVSALAPGERIFLRPGRYDVRAAIMRDTEEKDVRWVEGVEIAAGLLSAPGVLFPRSQLLVRAKANDKALDSTAVEVTVYRAGDDMLEIIETGVAEVPIELNPGAYHFEARLLTAADKPVRSVDSVELADGKLVESSVEFETATVHTQARLTGGETLDAYHAYVYFYRVGDHTQAIAYAPAGQPVVLSTGTYDLRASYFRSADQPDLWLRGVKLKPGEERHVPFDFPSGKLIVRAFDDAGEELIGDNVIIRVYSDQTRSGPVSTARSGELQVLSAGVYDIAVEDTRRAAILWLDGTRVSAGELTERAARLTPGPQN